VSIPSWSIGLQGLPDVPPDVHHLHLVFSREQLAGGVGAVVDDLMTLTEDARLRRQLTHGLSFSFDGWDHDPREIAEIPECRQFLQALHGQWPYWLHFLTPAPAQWSVLLLCLADIRLVEGSTPGERSFEVIQPGGFGALVRSMLTPLNVLHKDMQLTQPEQMDIFNRSLEGIQGCTR